VPAKLKLFWDRVTISKITIVYFIFSVIHCIIQVIFQAQAFTINAQAAHFLGEVIAAGNSSSKGFAIFGGPDLMWCTSVPDSKNTTGSCRVIWATSSEALMSSVAPVSSQSPLVAVTSTVLTSSVTAIPASSEVSSVAKTSASPSSSAAPATRSNERAVAITSSPVTSASASAPDKTTSAPSVLPTVSTKDKDDKNGEDDENKDDDENSLTRREDVVAVVSKSGENEVQVNDFNGKQITLDEKCVMALHWPESQVKNTKREDIVFICFQIWVLGMSVVALLNESIPHIGATLLTHIVATAWGGFRVADTKSFRADFVRLTTNGACGVNLLPTYWKMRANAEIPSLALNCVGLVVSGFLSWRLIKLFGWQTFKRVGASLTINRLYNVVLVLSIVIQLSGFFIVVSGGLWIDQVFNGDIGRLTDSATFFKATMIIVLIVLFPWLTTGWIAVRREMKIPMLIFLAFSLLYLVGWSAMFVSNTFRLTFLQWRFFSLMTSASVFLTAVTLVLGIICRINFGRGLRHHLEAEELIEDDDTTYYDEKSDYEKVAFPPSNAPVPTFSVAFHSGPAMPPPALSNFAPQFYGPTTTYNPTLVYNYGATSPPHAFSPTHSPEKGLARHESGSSHHSVASTSSGSSSGHSQRSKRWIIE
ncbi:hypothetical protein BXZ70DRAFT_1022326, partial [Cristinia sonorae]